MKRILFSISIFTSCLSFSQFDVSIHTGGGVSYISNSATVNMNHLTYGAPVRAFPKASLEGGITASYAFKRHSFDLGVLYSQIRSLNTEDTFYDLDYGMGLTHLYVEKMRTIGYLAIPLQVNRDYNLVSFGAGVQPQFALHVNEEKKMWTDFSDSPETVAFLPDDRTIRTFDLGWIGNFCYHGTKHLSLSLKVYWGLWNINNFGEKGAVYEFFQIENPVVDRKLKNRQFTMSVKYHIFGKKEGNVTSFEEF
ncbi:MAG: outer membrane beta-barrel protein [Crocinitomicaceae bacterium]|nr:outer membrane beta-barrel protein [Crocinitomicaceae bacterium]